MQTNHFTTLRLHARFSDFVSLIESGQTKRVVSYKKNLKCGSKIEQAYRGLTNTSPKHLSNEA